MLLCRRLFLIFFHILLCAGCPVAFAQETVWVKQIGTADAEESYRVCVDRWDNLVLLTYRDSLYLSRIKGSTGEAVWTRGYSVYPPNQNSTLTTDVNGDIYLSGGGELLKVNGMNGAVLWRNTHYGLFANCDEEGNVFMTLGVLSPANVGNLFLLKLDGNGKELWRRRITTKGKGYHSAFMRDARGHFFVAGTFTGEVTLGAYTLSSASPFNASFVARLDQYGNVEWVTQAEGWATINDLKPDAADNLYVSGYAYTSVVLGVGEHTAGIGMPGPGTFTGKLDAGTGRLEWGRYSGDASYLVPDTKDNMLLLGSTFSNNNSGLGADPFNCGRDKPFTLGGPVSWRGFAADRAHQVYATGSFTGAATVGQSALTAVGDRDVFLAKFRPFDPGLLEACGEDLLQLFPNPAGDELNIRINKIMTEEYTFRIINTQGKVMLQSRENDSARYYSVKDLPAGLYFAVLDEHDGHRSVKKFIKLGAAAP